MGSYESRAIRIEEGDETRFLADGVLCCQSMKLKQSHHMQVWRDNRDHM